MSSSADIDRILQLLNKEDVESLKKEDYDMFQYVGFDPYRLLQALMERKKGKAISDDEFMDDVLKMVAIGLIKGNVNDHNMTKMSDKGQADLKTLMGKYQIAKGGARGKAASVVTFPRVAATFPNLAVRMTRVVGGKRYTGPLGSNSLPDVMSVQVFPSVIPFKLDPTVKSFFLTAALAYSIDQTIKISQMEPEKTDLKALAKTQSSFVQLSHTSPMPKEDVRIQTFNVLGLPGSYKNILVVVEKYRELIDNTIIIPSESDYKKALSVV